MAAPRRTGAPLCAYVLHRWDWSETSLVVELFTREQGRLVVVAKGAKRPTSQLRAVLLPFQPLHAQLGRAAADAPAEIHPLRSAEWAGGAPLLSAAALLPGYYLNELVMKGLAREDPHPGLFDAYAGALAALATTAAAAPAGAATDVEAATLRAFELALLREAGLLPDLALQPLDGALLQPARAYQLLPETGLVPAAADTPGALPGATWVALQRALQSGDAGAALRAACAPVALALRRPLQHLVQQQLGHAVLRTRQLRVELQRLAGTAARPAGAAHDNGGAARSMPSPSPSPAAADPTLPALLPAPTP